MGTLGPPVAVPEVRRELVRIALPVVGLNLLGVLSLGVDMAMCGHLPDGARALVALGFATQVVLATNVTVLGLTVGAVALIARAHGARDPARVAHVLAQSIVVTALAALVVGALATVLTAPLLRWLGADAEARATGALYLRPMLGLAVFHFLSTLLAGAMRAVGRTSLPFVVALGTCALHILLAFALIHGRFGAPALGVRGAAWSAVLSQAASVVLLLGAIARGAVPGLRFERPTRLLDVALVRRLGTVGLPAALDMLIIHGSFLVIVAMLATFGGESVAANSVGLRVQSLAFVPGLAISQATAAMVGAALGASDETRARDVAGVSVRATVALMLVLGVVVAGLASPILGVFAVHEGSAIHGLARTWMRLLGLSLPIAGANIALVGVLRGAGATTSSLLVNALGTLVVQIPLGYALAYGVGLGALGVWLAVPFAFAARLALSLALYRRGAWARTAL